MKTFPLAVALLAAAVTLRAAPPDALEAKEGKSTIALSAAGKPVLEYAFADVPFKPYARALFTPSGLNVLRDAPADHLHHHALMFALKVNDTNFWEEAAKPGFQVERKRAVDAATGTITQELEWRSPDKKDVLLLETRRIAVHPRPDPAATLLTWRSTLAAPPGKPSVKVGGSHYFGLGMRFPREMDGQGPFLSANPTAGQGVRGTEKLVTGTRWCAYRANLGDKPVTVAMFDGPANFRPATFFTMTQKFAYLSATLNVHKEPFTIEQGKPVTLTYGVLAADGKFDAPALEKLCEAWRGELKNTKMEDGR